MIRVSFATAVMRTYKSDVVIVSEMSSVVFSV
jgi:hypothetical protein